MRKVIGLFCISVLAACGGGGSSSGGTGSVPSGAATPTAAPSGGTPTSSYARPTFTIVIPSSSTNAAARRTSGARPEFVSAGALSVSVQLTSDSAGITPSLLTPNPAITNVNGSSGNSCNSGCTIEGPPSPPGTDAFTVTLYTSTNGGGTVLDTGSTSATITEGENNINSITLEGVPATLSFTALPTTWSAGVGENTIVSVTALDALGNTITGTYANAVTLSDPDTNSDGTRVASGSCPSTTTPNTGGASTTSVSIASSTSTAIFCYLGLAESPVTLTASASGATSGTRSFSPILNLPTSGATTGAFVGTDAQLNATTGTGSTGTIAWTESGFTGAPYEQTLSVDSAASTCSTGGPLSTFATANPAYVSFTTVFTVTSASPYTPGKCTVPVWDGVTGTNAYTPPTFSASYTTSGITVDSTHRHR